jgi:SulP family sulfate permease
METTTAKVGFWGELYQNLLAGLTVSFVAISLGAAFGILSGRGAFAGIISAGLIALVTGALGGTRLQCSGPTAPMTAVTATVVAMAHDRLAQQYPGLPPAQFINLVLLLCGALMLLMAALRLGRFIQLVPQVVISGFMNGIAVLIWLDQVQKLFGWGGKTAIGGPTAANVVIALVTLLMVFWLPGLIKRYLPRLRQFLPATILAILVCSAAVKLLGLPVERVSLETTLGSWHDLTQLVKEQIPTQWSWALLWLAAPFALELAVLGYLDTLLTSLIIDKKILQMYGRVEKTRQNQELLAQGLANASVALVGGIPGAQATIRSVLILNEGATLRLASYATGVFVLIEMLLFQDYINLIPQAVFAGLLIKVGYDVFDWAPVVLYVQDWLRRRAAETRRARVGHLEICLIAGTALVTILVNLNVAVLSFVLLFYILRALGNHIPDLQQTPESD